MKLGFWYVVFILLIWFGCAETSVVADTQVEQGTIRNGDIIFQTSMSRQSKAIQLATDSKYSHVGIIYKKSNSYYVYEAVQPVKLTRFEDWIQRGKDKHYVVKRLKNAGQVLTPEVLNQMHEVGEKYNGKSYDLYFECSDDKIYCSELVWKIYNEAANIQIGELEQLSDFDLSSAVVQAKMKERYGNDVPMEELVISPAAIFQSDKLETVLEE